MQKRIHASFQKEWAEENVTLISFAAFVPHVTQKNGELYFEDDSIWGLWSMEHFLSLILGEIPRLYDDENGYGPNGRGFISHVEVPAEILEAYERVQKVYGTFNRGV